MLRVFCLCVFAAALRIELKPAPSDTLVIVIGTHRGGELPWHSLQKHVLKPWNAHLAVFVADAQKSIDQQTSLAQQAQYIWENPEHSDWGVILDTIPGIDQSWRSKFCEHHITQPNRNLWGGIKMADCGFSDGSGGILLAYRWLVFQEINKLLQQGIKYKHVVLTRSDFLYGCDMPPMSEFSGVIVPRVEGYGGYTDRFALMTDESILTSLNITANIMTTYEQHLEVLKKTDNLERLLKWYWEDTNTAVQLFRHPAMTVKLREDQSRSDKGVKGGTSIKGLTDVYGLYSKYPHELKEVQDICGAENFTKELRTMAQEIQLGRAVWFESNKA